MALARETVRLGLGARGKAKIKVRQPLGEAVVVADGREREAIERLAEIVREELNVRRVRFVAAAEELGELRGQGQLPHARTAVRQGHAAGRGGDRGARPRARGSGACASGEARGRHRGRRPRAHAVGGGRDPDDARARGLQRRARGRARGRARSGDRRRAARARATRARSCTRCRTRARPPGLQVEDRIELALTGTRALLEAASRTPRLHRGRDVGARAGPRRGELDVAALGRRPTTTASRPRWTGWSSTIALRRASDAY